MRKARSRRQIGANGRRSSKITRHTLSNKFWPISLKTKARGLRQASQESSSETGAHVACRAEIPAELTACAVARETFLLDTRTGSRITNHGSPVTNHRFLIDTEAIRNALKSLRLSAETLSNRHGDGGLQRAISLKGSTKNRDGVAPKSPHGLRVGRRPSPN